MIGNIAYIIHWDVFVMVWFVIGIVYLDIVYFLF